MEAEETVKQKIIFSRGQFAVCAAASNRARKVPREERPPSVRLRASSLSERCLPDSHKAAAVFASTHQTYPFKTQNAPERGSRAS